MSAVQTPLTTLAPRIAIGAIILYQLILVALIFLRPDLDPSWHTISEWAIGPFGWLMSLAFLISASGYAALYRTLRAEVKGTLGTIGLGLLVVCIAGTIGVGLFHTDPMTAHSLSLRGTIHVICGTSALVLLPFAALLINFALAKRNASWVSEKLMLRTTAFVPLAGFAAFAIYTAIYVAPLGPHAYGPGVNIGWPPRVAFFSYMIWVVTLSGLALRATRSFAERRSDRSDRILQSLGGVQ